MIEMWAIVAIVERGMADQVVKKAKASGARGATVFYGRGTGQDEFKRFFRHLEVESSKEIILIIAGEPERQSIMDTIVDAAKLSQPGKGIVFTIPVTNLVGLEFRTP